MPRLLHALLISKYRRKGKPEKFQFLTFSFLFLGQPLGEKDFLIFLPHFQQLRGMLAAMHTRPLVAKFCARQ